MTETIKDRRDGERAGLTLVEAMVVLVLFSGLLGLTLEGFRATAHTASTTAAMTDAQVLTESLLRRLRQELSLASSLTGNAPVVTDPPGAAIEISYRAMDLSRTLFDPADPLAPPWSEERVIKLEQSGAELLNNGADDDRDWLEDEGQLSLYRRVSGIDTPLAVLGVDVADLTVTYNPVAAPLPELRVTLAVERVLPGAIRSNLDVIDVPVTRHTANALIPLLN